MMPKFKIFVEFSGDPDETEIVELQTKEEADYMAKEQALERISYGEVAICNVCEEEIETTGLCSACQDDAED